MAEMDLVGKTLGRFKIVEEIGRAGMGTVYKALDSSRNRHVALKVLSPFLQANREFLKRFHREAHATARLRHPNIIKVYEAGQIESISFIAVEYIDSGSVRDRLKSGRRLDLATTISIVGQISSALDYAHARGIVHRDIPTSVGEVLLHALEKAPRTRYQSASELAADLLAGFLAPRARARAEAIRRPRTTLRGERRPIPRAREGEGRIWG